MQLHRGRWRLLGRVAARTGSLVIFLWLATGVIFIAMQFLPGDATYIILGAQWNPQEAQVIRQQLGLDKPVLVQWLNWSWNALHGNLGASYLDGIPVTQWLARTVPHSMELALMGFTIALAAGIPLGVIAAVRKDSWIDNTIRSVVIFGVSMPIYLLAYILMWVFGVQFHLLPLNGIQGPESYILPAASLAIFLTPSITKVTRSSMISVIDEDYVRTARSKGLSERIVMFKHALRNALIPVVSLSGVQIAQLIGSAFLVEYIFGFPGVGRLMIESILARDKPLVIGAMIVAAGALMVASWIVDILYAIIDPRVR